MESLVNERDRAGAIVKQGTSVFGNKGSTSQCAYNKQFRYVISDFFCMFLEMLSDGESSSLMVDRNTTTVDYLAGFYLGTRQALFENGRDSTVQEVSQSGIAVMITIFDGSVGFYASLVNISAYHQPSVEAGKEAADAILTLQKEVSNILSQHLGKAITCVEIAHGIANPDGAEHIFKICARLSTNLSRMLTRRMDFGPFGTKREMT